MQFSLSALLPVAMALLATRAIADNDGACVVSIAPYKGNGTEANFQDYAYCGSKTKSEQECVDLQKAFSKDPIRVVTYSCQLGAITNKSLEDVEQICTDNDGELVPASEKADYVKTGQCGNPNA